MRSLCLISLSLAFAAGCGPSPGTTSGTTSDDSSASEDVTTGMSDGTSTSETDTSGVPTTGPTTTTTTDTSATTDSTSTTEATTAGTDTDATTGEVVCGAPDSAVAKWSLEFQGERPASLSVPCTVDSATESPPEWTIAFDCTIEGAAQAVHLAFTREPFPGQVFFPGQEVQLEYRSEQPFWLNQWFSIRAGFDPKRMIFGGVSADRFVPDGTSAEEFYSTPIEVLDGLCEPSDGLCGLSERLALAVTWLEITIEVFDGQHGANSNLPGTYSVWLETAERPVEPAMCDDVPPAWFQALLEQHIGP
ncbi:hypothetical protein [Nannocystis radixulma]|uniref:CBM2 domain-containing protein n=1 Tax=Nannocystis radixulma TaxID=2995305 RepID=A0ABT5B8H6_9BACT|nr:hypothetical protein [Nannocystis radixulma]MDC0670425.1 hypothetical protein [Nannocystis radixulma]